MAYKIYITPLNNEIGQVIAYLPDDFGLALEHKWENPFDVDLNATVRAGIQWLSNKKFSGVWDSSDIGKSMGIDAYTYMGSSPLNLSIELEFLVQDNIDRDLIIPVKKLLSMSSPKKGEGATLRTLGVPSPVFINIPHLLKIPKAYITNVGTNFMKPLVSDGTKVVPMRIKVPITIVRASILTSADVENELFSPNAEA